MIRLTFADLRRRRLRRSRSQKFFVDQVANREAWAPFCGIEDLGSAVPGALLFESFSRVSDHTLKDEHPIPGS